MLYSHYLYLKNWKKELYKFQVYLIIEIYTSIIWKWKLYNIFVLNIRKNILQHYT